MFVYIVHGSLYLTAEVPESQNVGILFSESSLKDIDTSSVFILSNGRKVSTDTTLENRKTYHIIPRLPGGKGGFGSMLRAIGAQIEKTTSREACRDLSGRRMRDINNEKKLNEWLAKENERESEREQCRQEKRAKQLTQNSHKFDDAEYHEQRAKMQEDLQDALSKGLKRIHSKGAKHASAGKKMKVASESVSSKAEWIGVDIEDSSSSDGEANPGDPDIQMRHISSCSRDNSSDEGTSSSAVQSSDSAGKEQLKTDEINKRLSVEELHQAMSQNCHGQITKVIAIEQASSKNTDCMDGREVNTDTQKQNCISTIDFPEFVSSDEPVDLDRYSCKDGVAKLGMERLKHALMVRGLKCGGTLEERAERLFSVKGLTPDKIDPSLFAKCKGKGKKSK